jgi:hypothetical protein
VRTDNIAEPPDGRQMANIEESSAEVTGDRKTAGPQW